jgi:hypothetical protein
MKENALGTRKLPYAGGLFVILVLSAASIPAFYQQTLGSKLSDIPIHFSPESPSSYSILALFVRALLMMSADPLVIGWIAIALLTLAVVLKGVLSLAVLSKTSGNAALSAVVAVALAFVMPIVNWWNYKSVYLGQIAPTIWHNSTTILVMPVVIVLFYMSLEFLRTPSLRNAALTSTLCVLSAAIKPSYVIALMPVLAAWFCYTAGIQKKMRLQTVATTAAILLGPVAFVLLVQGLIVSAYLDTRAIVAPFAVWSLYSPHPLASLILSLAFPLAVLLLYRDNRRGNEALVLAWAVFAIALLQFVLLAEPGPRFSAANFLWGPCMALYLVFLASAEVFCRQPMSARSVVVLTFFLLHLGSGVYFYWRIVTGLGYFA